MSSDNLAPYRFSHFAMGTVFEVVIAETDETYARQASQALFYEIDRVESILSRFDPGSEIGQINMLTEGQSLIVSADVYACLEKSFDLQQETKGAFDINYRVSEVNPKRSLASLFTCGRNILYPPIDLCRSEDGFRVRFKQRRGAGKGGGLDLDLGGIGKGFALEKAAGLFSDWGIDHVLIHAGTSTVLARGAAPFAEGQRDGWPVGIGGSWSCLKNKKFSLKNRALSGSGTEVKGMHISDPRKGKRASGNLAAWVSHSSAAVADALSTAFMVMGKRDVAAFCENDPQIWALVLIDPEHFEVYNKGRLEELPTG